MKKVFFMAVMALWLLTGCNHKKSAAETAGALPVEVALPYVQEITLTKDYPGHLDAEATVSLVGRVNGNLQSINFNPGDRVKAGQLLFIIEPTLYEDALQQAEASLKTAEASLSYARSNFERMQAAIQSDAVSRIQYLEAQANVAEGEAAVDNAKAALRTARTDLDYCYVTAPYDGQIDRSVYSVGNYIAGAGSPVTLAHLYKDDLMYSYFNVSDNQWLAQTLSQELTRHDAAKSYYVTVSLGPDGKRSWPAKLDYLSPNIDLNTGTLEVRAEMHNEEGLLKPGAYISITLPYAQVDSAVLVPDAAISTDQLGKYLYVVNDSNVVHYRPVTAGQLVNDTLRWIKSGLSPRERYVTKALLKVHDGMAITPIEGGKKSYRRMASK